MYFSLAYIIILLHSLEQISLVVSVPTSFLYEQDLSEHCKRRAMPSVFLWEHVRLAASKTLLFSKSELPYNCFITVKTQPANELILIIQKVTLSDLKRSCTQHSDQLLVFEMGETFGGYWGPMIKKNFEFDEGKTTKPGTVYYTLETTQPTVNIQTTRTSSEEETESTEPFEPESTTEAYNENENEKTEPTKKMIVEEFPLLELSGRTEAADDLWTPPTKLDDRDNFDIAPRKGEKYITNTIPIVRIVMSEQSEDSRREHEQLFQLDYEVDSPTRIKPKTKYPFINRRLYTTRSRLFSKKFVKQLKRTSIFDNFKTLYEVSTQSSIKATVTTHSWDHLMKLIKNIETTKSIKNISTIKKSQLMDSNNKTRSNLSISVDLGNIEYTNHMDNSSNISTPAITVAEPAITGTSTSASSIPNELKTTEASTEHNFSEKKDKEHISYSQPGGDVDNENSKTIKPEELTTKGSTTFLDHENDVDSITVSSRIRKNSTKQVTGAMVGHESWENVVQAAPKMAMILNQSTANTLELSNDESVSAKSNERKMRHIQAVLIENAKPHTLSTKAAQTRSSGSLETQSIYDFARFVELQDDEMHGRVHLRYLRQYVGPMAYNICESVEESKQQIQRVHLFNSSRLVIAINNFTLNSMRLILTTVRLVPKPSAHCSPSHLECQVSGARVCVDSCVACDGVPNCGSGDTYDEDRHMCGAAALHYNVYLAAATFLAVLCTLLYIVHYWIKRCVPKVSDAFFVYTDGAENVLYLDTIMRSPNDADETSKILYHGNIFEDDLDPYLPQQKRKTFFGRFIEKINFLSRPKVRHHLKSEAEVRPELLERERKIYSFQALEIMKMMKDNTVDEAIQTGPSLELKKMPTDTSIKSLGHDSESDENLAFMNIMTPNHKKELNILKLLQMERPEPGTITPRPSENKIEMRVGSAQRSAGSEEELRSMLYDARPRKTIDKYISMESYERIMQDQPGTSGHARKRLRFEEAATAIPSTSQTALNEENRGTNRPDQSQHTESGPKDFMWFWTGSKTKKHKKKSLPPSSR